jgi:hypothetical protein
MKRFLTIGTSVLVIAVGGSMLATPAQAAATTSFTCSEDQLVEAQQIAEEYCGGRFSEAYVTCPSSGPMTMEVDTYC